MEPFVEPKAKPRLRFRWIFAALAVLFAGFVYYQFFYPSRVIVSRETTYLTEPLRANGMPDYGRYLVERQREGVTPENNAAVPLWQALFPADIDQQYWLLMSSEMGLDTIPSADDALEELYSASLRQAIANDLAERFANSDAAAVDRFSAEPWQLVLRDTIADDLIGRTHAKPWTSEQLPAVAEWIERNERPLDLLVEASSRTHYYWPSPNLIDGSNTAIIGILLNQVQAMRTANRALTTRAMRHLGEGRPEEAWRNLLANYRLARFLGHGDTLVEQLVGVAIEGVSHRCTLAILSHGNLTPELAERIHSDLAALGPVADPAHAFQTGERFFALDTIVRFSQGEMNKDDLGLNLPDFLLRGGFDWNHLLRYSNTFYDRILAAYELPNYGERRQALELIETEMNSLYPQSSVTSGLGVLLNKKRRGEALLAMLLPAVSAFHNAIERDLAQGELIEVASALELYRARRGEYPAQLADLAPDILPEAPQDHYVDAPLQYTRKPDGGYLLYSVFENGVDDGGTDFGGEIVAGEWVDGRADVDYGNSDIVVRLPMPAFKLPTLEEVEELVDESSVYGEFGEEFGP